MKSSLYLRGCFVACCTVGSMCFGKPAKPQAQQCNSALLRPCKSVRCSAQLVHTPLLSSLQEQHMDRPLRSQPTRGAATCVPASACHQLLK